ncbi:MAG: DNA repair and recombination protein RadB [Methanomicrobiales archaeon]|nr:DNA repair and recombination protein RadB [Methanomicrobiales archaeon]NYT21635.1 DNA repair and recombination protein RadB [Methanomicrobiales archaeon]
MRDERLSTGVSEFDDLLGGGLEPGVITQLYGGPGSGKSVLCIIAAVSCLRAGKGVIFIDTEGFSIERFRQVAGDDAEALARDLILYEPHDFEQQGIMITGIGKHVAGGRIGLIVMDSATGLYRTQLDRGTDTMQRLSRQIIHLLGYARKHTIPVLITNQVYMDIQRNVFIGLGGTALAHISKVIVRIDRLNGTRRAVLEKHRSRPGGGSFAFDIVERGIAVRERADGLR